MSILDVLTGRVNERPQRLYELHPPMGYNPDVPRWMYVAKGINELLNTYDTLPVGRAIMLRTHVDRFAGGLKIPVLGRDSNLKEAYLRQLLPFSEEVWELRHPGKPGIAILGRFAAPNRFVALTWRKGFTKAGSEGSRSDLLGCKTAWDHLFYPHLPMEGRGAYEHRTDYITNSSFLV